MNVEKVDSPFDPAVTEGEMFPNLKPWIARSEIPPGVHPETFECIMVVLSTGAYSGWDERTRIAVDSYYGGGKSLTEVGQEAKLGSATTARKTIFRALSEACLKLPPDLREKHRTEAIKTKNPHSSEVIAKIRKAQIKRMQDPTIRETIRQSIKLAQSEGGTDSDRVIWEYINNNGLLAKMEQKGLITQEEITKLREYFGKTKRSPKPSVLLTKLSMALVNLS